MNQRTAACVFGSTLSLIRFFQYLNFFVNILGSAEWYGLVVFALRSFNSYVDRCVIMLNGRFSLRILYCVVDTGYGLGGSFGDCRPALGKGQKYQMVKTQIESHDRGPIV